MIFMEIDYDGFSRSNVKKFANRYEDIFPLKICLKQKRFMYFFRYNKYELKANNEHCEDLFFNLACFLKVTEEELKLALTLAKYDCDQDVFDNRKDAERFIEEYIEPKLVMMKLTGQLR